MSQSDLHEKARSHVTTTFIKEKVQTERVLLATARVKVFNSQVWKHCNEALLSQTPQNSYVSISGLKRKGLGDGHTKIKYKDVTSCTSRSNLTSFYVDLERDDLLMQPTLWEMENEHNRIQKEMIGMRRYFITNFIRSFFTYP